MPWRPANIEPENNRAWAGVHWLNQEIRAESIAPDSRPCRLNCPFAALRIEPDNAKPYR